MKRFNTSVFFPFLFLLVACSGVKTEKWPNGYIKSEISMHGKERNGPAKYWYEDGTIQMECTYKKNKLEGILTRYLPTGYKEELQTYKNDTLNGQNLQWDRLGDLVVEAYYAKGKLHGHYRELYPNKQTKTEGLYVNGDIDGQWLYFDESGQVVGMGNFIRGNGIQKSYYPENGQLKIMTPYKNNFKEGEEIEYSPEGKKMKINIYSKGDLIETKTTLKH